MSHTHWVLAIMVDNELSASLHATYSHAEQTLREVFDHLGEHIDGFEMLSGDDLTEAVENAYTPRGYCLVEISECPVWG